jgi:hypothetical protein
MGSILTPQLKLSGSSLFNLATISQDSGKLFSRDIPLQLNALKSKRACSQGITPMCRAISKIDS